jgi:hypothetical protein
LHRVNESSCLQKYHLMDRSIFAALIYLWRLVAVLWIVLLIYGLIEVGLFRNLLAVFSIFSICVCSSNFTTR